MLQRENISVEVSWGIPSEITSDETLGCSETAREYLSKGLPIEVRWGVSFEANPTEPMK